MFFVCLDAPGLFIGVQVQSELENQSLGERYIELLE